MKKKTNNKERAWVCFMPHDITKKKTLFQWLFVWCLQHMKQNFSHVAVYRRSGLPGWIVGIDCCAENLVIEEMPLQSFFKMITEKNITCIDVDVQDGEIQAKGFITCVSIAKHYLGVDNWFIITPYQLYKYLKKKKEKSYGKKESV